MGKRLNLSALVTKHIDEARIKILPPEYSYPLYFNHEMPAGLRPGDLSDLVCPVYEGDYVYPDTLNGLEALEKLKNRLIENDPGTV